MSHKSVHKNREREKVIDIRWIYYPYHICELPIIDFPLIYVYVHDLNKSSMI